MGDGAKPSAENERALPFVYWIFETVLYYVKIASSNTARIKRLFGLMMKAMSSIAGLLGLAWTAELAAGSSVFACEGLE